MKKLILLILLFTSSIIYSNDKEYSERYFNTIMCDKLGGELEKSVPYDYGYIYIDCESKTRVIEGGLDKRSSLDSVQQALFASFLTGKKPAVIIYNTDGEFGQYEYRIFQACLLAGVEFYVLDHKSLISAQKLLWKKKN